MTSEGENLPQRATPTATESPLKEGDGPIHSSSSTNELQNGGGIALMGTISAAPPPLPPSLTPNTYLIQLSEVERKKAIINVLSTWMDIAASDFLEDRPAYVKLERLIQTMLPVAKQMAVPEEAKQIEESLLQLKGKMQVKFLRHWTSRNSYQDVRKTPLSNAMVSGTLTTARKRTFTVEEMQQSQSQGASQQQMDQFGPEELAQQLTLIHYDLVAKIRAKEFIRQAWNKPGMDQNAPNVIACIKRLNWVGSFSSHSHFLLPPSSSSHSFFTHAFASTPPPLHPSSILSIHLRSLPRCPHTRTLSNRFLHRGVTGIQL